MFVINCLVAYYTIGLVVELIIEHINKKYNISKQESVGLLVALFFAAIWPIPVIGALIEFIKEKY